jgi:hypothetical protein
MESADREAKLRGTVQQNQIDNLLASVAAIKDLLAKGGATVLKSEAEKLRDQFVRGELRRETTREAVESQG